MTKERPDIRPAGRYSITEAAAILGMSRQHMNRLANTGAVRSAIRKSNGRRYVTGLEIMRVWSDSF